MRYLIITYDDYFNIPYIRFYEEALKRSGQEYDIVLWNRSGQQVELPNALVFSAEDHHSKLAKLKPFWQWRQFVKKALKQKSYDRLIVLTTLPAVLLTDVLLRDWKGRYWLDIRDFTYENVFFYKDAVKRLVLGAKTVSISSPSFRSFLPQSGNICLTHNITNVDSLREKCTLDPGKRPVNIAFVGGVRYYEQNKQLLRQFARRQEDYRLSYVGKPHLGFDLPQFCQQEGIANVSFQPAFANEEKPRILESVDLINGVYGDGIIEALALPNRLYDCALFKKPMLVSKGTYLAQVVEQYHLGLAVDVKVEGIPEAVDQYLAEFCREAFEAGCREFLEKVEQELTGFYQALEDFCGPERPGT